LIDRCLALNPSHAPAWHWGGLLRIFAGQPKRALDDFENYLQLSPRDRLASYMNGIGEAHFFCRRFDKVTANLLGSLERAPDFPITYRVLASCYAHMGRLDDAQETVRRLPVITPVVVERATRYRNPEYRELFCQVCDWRPVRRADTHLLSCAWRLARRTSRAAAILGSASSAVCQAFRNLREEEGAMRWRELLAPDSSH
jgi:tetratricopeptide (TPR) repeat protein